MSSREIMNAQGFSKKKFSLDCDYYNEEFDSVNDLINDIASSGMDPNYEITKNNKGIGEQAIDLIVF